MATFAIGDIHGNLQPLEGVIRLIEAEVDAEDTVVFLGDYIDRGRDTAACLDAILTFQQACPAPVVGLLGNHEDWLLRTLNDPTDHCWWLASDARATVESYSAASAAQIHRAARAAGLSLYEGTVALPYASFFDAMPPGHLAFLRSLRPFLRTADAVCVHGGIDPAEGPPETQPRRALVWGAADFQRHYAGDPPLVYGHWSNAVLAPDGRAGPPVIRRTIGIDSIKHGTLTALKMPDGLVLQSDGRRSWAYSSLDVRELRPVRGRV